MRMKIVCPNFKCLLLGEIFTSVAQIQPGSSFEFFPSEFYFMRQHADFLVLHQSPSSIIARIQEKCAAGIAFSADLTLRWWADGFWDFFQGVDAGQLSGSHRDMPVSLSPY